MYKKKYKKKQKTLAKSKNIIYNATVVTLIALKREVAVEILQVFRGANVKLENWRQVTVQINCPAMTGNNVWANRVCSEIHTGACTVTACRT